MITAATVHQIHKVLRSCFRQAVKWEMMDKNPAIDATLPKYKAEEREIWTAEMLMQAIDACENKECTRCKKHTIDCTESPSYFYYRCGKNFSGHSLDIE